MHRILRGTAATLTYVNLDADGSPAETGAVTVGVTRADGTEVLPPATAATTVTGTGVVGVYTVTLTPAQTAILDHLTATWTDGDSSHETYHEVVGGFYFSVKQARESDASIGDPGKYSDADIIATRQEVEEEFEVICGVAFVPRHRRVTLSGRGTSSVILPDPLLRRVRSLSVSGTALDATELAALTTDLAGMVLRTSAFPLGAPVVVEYEHGHDAPPADLRRAALTRLRSRLNFAKSSIPDRATSFAVTEGGTYRLSMPGERRTGIPEVDAVLERYSFDAPVVA